MFRYLLPLTLSSALLLTAASDAEIQKVLALAKQSTTNPEFRQALTQAIPEKERLAGASLSYGGDFLYVIEGSPSARLQVDDLPVALTPAGGLLFYRTVLKTGRSHSMQWFADGSTPGTRVDQPAYLPENYPRPGVPQGTLSPKMIGESKIYPGLKYDWWTYVPAQYDGSTPMAVMIWQDGQNHVEREGASRTLNVIDNLTHGKKIPVMISIFISPGLVGTQRWRSIQYDSVNDTYARYLRDEILTEVAKKYKIRMDGYSRAIAGNSSGGICAFNAAWFMPDQFSRVLSRIGSFTSIQWKPGVLDGGNVYPNMVRKQAKRNIRVYMTDGNEDLENDHGSWPLQNIQLANSLKMREYDFYFFFGNSQHNGSQGNADLPASLVWLWRDYDPAKTEQVYTMDPTEKTKPYFRVAKLNRE
ncbi:MAG TPA: alpha/beta hydrolase-fold protein [Bryobacteraceae bacterium]|jgi:enterochelin esterase-like enzyme|nr:alpha/beta hydrolase-fold protein [Bryobacteraceae bacterium]